MTATSQDNFYGLLMEGLGDFAYGTDPCDAVRQHYESLDRYCSVPDDVPDDPWIVTVFLIPQSIVDSLPEDYFFDMESMDEKGDAILALAEKHTDITKTEVKAAY